ncbi:MAG: hypothetical protein EBX52_01275 [Proteobacteria bacterium]|nr:hypothetical protein [Pseudomonadota bacterium]
MLDPFLRHVTKDSYGPVSFTDRTQVPVVVHRFHDSYSILGWGKMPDAISDRARISANIFTLLNRRYQSHDSWKSFLRSPEALSFRKAGASIAQGGSVSSHLNEVSDRLPIRSNFLGVVDEREFKLLDPVPGLTAAQLLGESPRDALQATCPPVFPVCEYFPEEKIPVSTVMGRSVWDHSIWRKQAFPKILPFSFLCHFSMNEESLRVLRNDAISIPKTASVHTLQPGVSWDFPVIEMPLAQDPLGRRIGLSEAMWITGMNPTALQDLMLSAAWIAAWTRSEIRATKLNLESVELRFAVLQDGSPVLVDAFQLDDLGIEKEGTRFRFESALAHYRKTSWFDAVVRAKAQAQQQGWADWRKQCAEPAPPLDPAVRARIEAEHRSLMQAFQESAAHVL